MGIKEIYSKKMTKRIYTSLHWQPLKCMEFCFLLHSILYRLTFTIKHYIQT